MADDGSQQRKPDFRSVLEDVKALATVVVMELESVLGLRLNFRSPAVLAAIGVVGIVLVLSSIVTVLNGLGFADRTLFEWMDILIVPLAVGIALYSLEQLQRRREENEREQVEALQGYLNQMISEDLTAQEPSDEVVGAAQVRTLSILSILDPVRKGRVVKFLHEAKLVRSERPIIELVEADLNGAFLRNQVFLAINLVGAHLREANLIAADLRASNLQRAIMISADLREADLRGADLRRADLLSADLRTANLQRAQLQGANLRKANLQEARPRGANLQEANLQEANLEGARLRGAEFRRANLQGANLRGASLLGADLGGADLSGADLSDADLTRANLSGAVGITAEQLEQQSLSLEGAIMPDGSAHP